MEISLTRTFEAEHSLPAIGVTERHAHSYDVECGYAARVDPQIGCARPLQELAADIDRVIEPLRGSYLNDVLEAAPTAEMLACWILARLPAPWEWVAIRAYGGYRCTIRRSDLPV
ncbi:MAG TPA: 6-carboxytetrahydropterin synthase [Burkholderiales bacterium]|nr:6-carboxytetrahydropterin synthase [Burkholderiales bacterium]